MPKIQPLPQALAAGLVMSLLGLTGSFIALSVTDIARIALGVPAQSVWMIQALFGANLLALIFGLVSALNDNQGGTFVRITLPIMGLLAYGTSVLNLLLVGCLALDWRPDRAWLLALIIPAISGGWLWFHTMLQNEVRSTSPVDEPPEPPLIGSARSPVETPGKILSGSAIEIGASVLWITAVMILLFIGTISFTLLRRLLFEDAIFTTDILPGLTRTAAWAEGLVSLAVVPIVIALVFGSIALGRAWILRSKTRDPQRFNRALTEREEQFLDEATRSLVDYAESRKYPGLWALAPFVLGLGGLVLGMALCFGTSYGITLGLRHLVASPHGESGLLLPLSGIGVASVLSVFVGCVLPWPFIQKGSEHFARFAEHLYVRHGWNTINSTPRSPGQYFTELETDLRLDRISAMPAFNPATYLQYAFRRNSAFSVKVGGVALGLCLAVSVLDGLAYQAFTEDRIYQSGYFEIGRNEYHYEDAVRIETACYMGSQDNRPALIVRYNLVMPDELKFGLEDLLGRSTLDALERIDAIALGGGAEPIEGARRGVGARGRTGLDPECLPQLNAAYGDNATRVRALLRI